MPEQTVQPVRPSMVPGLDAEAIPLLSVGLGLTGLTLGLRPRFAALPLALTALTAVFFRDPERATPDMPDAVFAVSDGKTLAIDEVYEHRFLHTDAIRIATLVSPLDVPVSRSPVAGVVRFVQHITGAFRPLALSDAAESNARTYVGLETRWGPVLVVHIAGPLARHTVCRVRPGNYVRAGQRLGTTRFGSRTDLLVQRDSILPRVVVGQRVRAGITPLARMVPLA